MRSGTRQHTTWSQRSKGLVANVIRRVAVLFALLVAFCAIQGAPAEAGMLLDTELWQLEVYTGEDLDGDGYIGRPPHRDPPPIGGPVI